MRKISVLMIIALILLTGCAGRVQNAQDLNVEKILAERFKDSSSVWRPTKILFKNPVDNDELIVFYLNREGTINIARIAKVNEAWKPYVAAIGEQPPGDAITWMWSQLCNRPVEKDYAIGSVFYGYVNSPKVSRVVVGREGEESSYREARFKEFTINGKQVKLYYVFFKDLSGFKDNVIAFDKDGNVLFNNKQPVEREHGQRVIGETAPQAGIPEKVPFIFREKPARPGEPWQVRTGVWDLQNGQVEMHEKAIFTVDAEDFMLSWDGGKRIGISPSAPGSLKGLIDNRSDYSLSVLNSPLSSYIEKAKCPSHRDETFIVRNYPDQDYPVLEIHRPLGVEKIALKPENPRQMFIFRCVAILPGDDKVDAFLEYSNRLSFGGDTRVGLARATVRGDEVEWKIIAGDIDVSEAGAGTRMARVGNRIVIAEQDNTVKTVDIVTGNISPYEEVNRRIKNFQEKNVYLTECLSPPAVHGYRGALIVSWVPAAIEEKEVNGNKIIHWIPMRYILAIKDDRVLGEVKLVRDELAVIKDDQVKQKMVVKEGFPHWQFPRE
ncbi:hypothetical protein [Desulfoscipio geothermicus]|uniref:Lipoprotein n=1 Tax=Desulfoscipio geothermicus DSM 3669 TaxID=1121426 RepID=A0A1I6EHM6_9FIRM|nr:hypothetical protein [Desulfoscipio geothermicus]SFR17244.1 hypothetical protein SAMN05660706_14510 [Desulfoscipio geothermicus DSM 3669]